MKKNTTTWRAFGMLDALGFAAAGSASAQSVSCDRECLRGTMTAFLYALLEHDASQLPIADTLRLTVAWGAREEGGDQLTVWEAFKVYDGQIHAVEAFMRILPVELRSGGWE